MFDQFFNLFKKRPGKSLIPFLNDATRYIIYIVAPFQQQDFHQPCRWLKVVDMKDGFIMTETGERCKLTAIQHCIVTYTNGEIVYAEHPITPWPVGVHSMEPVSKPVKDTLKLPDLEMGQRFATVQHGPSFMPNLAKHYYSTTLHNISDQKIRVLKFAGYRLLKGNIYQLSTVTGAYFTAEEFCSWYGLGDKEWILPDQQACDKENYGGPGTLWAYFCQTESGEEFVVGSIVD